jgi:hypothetical protein
MKSNVRMLALIGILTLGLCGSGFAQSRRQKPSEGDKGGKPVTVTGCLQKGDEAGEYSIKGADGKEYGLRSTTVKLADHLNHKITVTGKPAHENERPEGNRKEQKEEHEHLNVTTMKMINNSCK